MARSNRIPTMRHHKATGQAVVTLNSRDFYLGKYLDAQGKLSKAAKQRYNTMIAEWMAADRSPSFGSPKEELTVSEVIAAYLRHAKAYYADTGKEHKNIVLMIRPLRRLYPSHKAADFGAAEFKAIRAWWLSDKKRTRGYINKQMRRTIRLVKWAVSEGMMSPMHYQAIKCVEPLKNGRCTAPEAVKILPVSDELVAATLPHLAPAVRAMVEFQAIVGCRPGEVCKIKPAMVDRTADVWEIRLDEHKTAHRGHMRTIYVGARAQAILAPYLLRAGDAYCFSPKEADRRRRAQRSEARITPLNQGNRPGYGKRQRNGRQPQKRPGLCYTTDSYSRAIRNACVEAELESWAPNQLRHSVATLLRKEYGLEAASIMLGHKELGVTQVYAEQDRSKAIEIARKLG